ncbi:MAG: ArnT family glycosyltransferase, partial [Tepidisphaeraceae bacterium]
MVLAGFVFLSGTNWGLPGAWVNQFLFADRRAWSGREVLDRLGQLEGNGLGADVDPNPIDRDASSSIIVNGTDSQRAEIVARYRLYSAQPDEMITFRALSTIASHRGDPRLYQYGGLWVYPIGALLKLSSMIGLVDLRADREFYLDHPHQFARFYIVARLYTVAFALAGVWAVFWIGRRIGGSNAVGALSALAYILLPVVVNMAHEAKPHLPAAVLILLAAIAATRFVDSGATRWWMLAAVLCGAAMSMVLSAFWGMAILPAMFILRRAPVRVLAASVAVCVGTYGVCNPFVMIHLLGERTVLFSNLANSRAMYAAGFGGFANAVRLLSDATTPAILVTGLAVAIIAMRKRSPIMCLLCAPGILVLGQFVLFAQAKPGEYARFALLPAIILAIASTAGLLSMARATWLTRS